MLLSTPSLNHKSISIPNASECRAIVVWWCDKADGIAWEWNKLSKNVKTYSRTGFAFSAHFPSMTWIKSMNGLGVSRNAKPDWKVRSYLPWLNEKMWHSESEEMMVMVGVRRKTRRVDSFEGKSQPWEWMHRPEPRKFLQVPVLAGNLSMEICREKGHVYGELWRDTELRIALHKRDFLGRTMESYVLLVETIEN
jgi:hypothetical protein